MKKQYIKLEMEVQEFVPEDTIMSSVFGSGAWCDGYSAEQGCNGADSEYVVLGPGCMSVTEDGTCIIVVS